MTAMLFSPVNSITINKMTFKYSTLVAILLFTGGVCGCSRSAGTAHQAEAEEPVPVLELALPEVPADLVQPEDRAAYIALHFWDNLDFVNDQRALDTAFVEQNFANFVSILPFARRDDAQRSIAQLLDRAASNQEAASLMVSVVDKYLGDPNSPMRSDELYVLFLDHISSRPQFGVAATERATYRLEQTSKNWPGTTATDIRLMARDGRMTTLREMVRRDTALVVFYDPDCEHCKEVTEHLKRSAVPERWQMVAIDVAGDRAAWDSTKHALPQSWQVAYAIDEDEVDEKYYLPALPSLYLLSPECVVLMKDIPSGRIPPA